VKALISKKTIEEKNFLVLEVLNCNKKKFCNILELFNLNNIKFYNYYKEKRSYFILFEYDNKKQINSLNAFIILSIILENE
jgi:hypothetical protein